MSKKEPQVTFEALGVHPAICSALDNHGISHPRELQRRTLSHTVHDFADVIAEAPPHSGRHTLLSVLAAHCVLSAEAKNANTILIANSTATSSKLLSVFHQLLSSTRVVALPCLDDRPPKASSPPSGGSAGTVYVGTFATFARWSPEHFASTVTLVMEDCHMHDVKQLQTLIDQVIQAAPSTNLFFLSAVPPSEVNLSIRYLLRRKHRRYFFQGVSQPHFSYLMCHDPDDRTALSLKLAQLSGCKNILMLTHNREVRDLKAEVQQTLGLKTFSIQRNTVPEEHDRILSDFLRSPYAILVAMDAYTGVDLMDLDAVIQFYPPQKSMPEEEWAEHVSYLQTTSDPRRRTLIATLVAPDDFSLVSYFMRRVGAEGPLLNISPTHPQFEHVVFHPEHALQQKLKITSNAAATQAASNATNGGSAAIPASTLITQAAGKSGGVASAGSPGDAADKHSAAASTVVPLPRSQRQADEVGHHSSPQEQNGGGKRKAEKQQQQQSRGSDKQGTASAATTTAAPAASQLLLQLQQASQRSQSGNNNNTSAKPTSSGGGGVTQSSKVSRGNGGNGGGKQPPQAAPAVTAASSSSGGGSATKGAQSQPQSQVQPQGGSKGRQQQQQSQGSSKQQQQSGGGGGKASGSAAGSVAAAAVAAPVVSGPSDDGQPEGSGENEERHGRRRHRRH